MRLRKLFVTATLLLTVLVLLAACHFNEKPPTNPTQAPIPLPVNGFMLSVGPLNGFELYVDGNGKLLAVVSGTPDLRKIISSLDLVGVPYEEAFITVLQAVADQYVLQENDCLLLSYVAMERGVVDPLCQRGKELVSNFLIEKGLRRLQINTAGFEFLPDTLPEDYALYEIYDTADYAALCAQVEYYDQLARNTEHFHDCQEHYVANAPFRVEFRHEGLWVQTYYRAPDTLESITLSSTAIKLSFAPVLGTDTYRVAIYGLDGSLCAIYYPDGQVDTGFGFDLFYSPVYGQVDNWHVYLPDADPQDYETMQSLMEKYEGLAIEHVGDTAILRIRREQDVLIIRYIIPEDRFEVCVQTDTTVAP